MHIRASARGWVASRMILCKKHPFLKGSPPATSPALGRADTRNKFVELDVKFVRLLR
jgi:hypothetical protein